jgi:hypothetical protein
MMDNTEHTKLAQMLVDAGFNNGWVLNGIELVLWEHDENPPAPLTRPA